MNITEVIINQQAPPRDYEAPPWGDNDNHISTFSFA